MNEDIDIEPLMVLSLQIRQVCALKDTPRGDRSVFDIEGGSFEGPRLRGRVLPTGGDWLTRVGERSMMDVRLVLETDDGATVLMRYWGRAGQAGGTPRIEMAATFDAAPGPCEWLNDVQAFGRGEPIPDGIRYHLYRFK